eukprot:8222208-Pyramimonas_sp.AAC.1
MASVPQLVFGTLQDCQGATLTFISGVEVPGMVFWRGSGVLEGSRIMRVQELRWFPVLKS